MSGKPSSREAGSTGLTLARGMQVLRAFKSDRAPLSNSEIVRCTGFSKAAVSRFTSTLMQLGYLRHVSGGREFELATGPLALGHAFLATSDLLQSAHRFMQDLADRLDVSVALGMRDGRDILYVGYRVSHRVGTLRLGVGSILPMGTTAIGRAYLWGLPFLEEQRQMIAELKRAAGRQATALDQGIRASFAEMEKTGTCAVLAGFQRDTYAVALPVYVGRDRTVMGLSCGKADVQPNLAAERKRIAPVLLKAAAEFEQLLSGFDGPP